MFPRPIFTVAKGRKRTINTMLKVNNKGRFYYLGKPLSLDTRENIVDEIKCKGGDKNTGIFLGRFTDVADKLGVSTATVSKVWKQYTVRRMIWHGGGNKQSLSDGDLQVIEVLKRNKPSTTYSELTQCLYEFGDLPEGDTSTTSICNAVRKKLPSGQFSLKKITTVPQERFTVSNMAYTQLFIDYLHGKDPYTLKYFDECGVKLPDCSARNYGHAPVGERAVEVRRYSQTANVTVNLLCGLSGVVYPNTVNGPSNTIEFLRFFEEAFNSINPNTERPCLEFGDVIIMDNCPFHHNEGGKVLKEFLNDLNIELVYMPCYSPDFNPAEYVFGKIKTLLKYRLHDLTNANLIQYLYNAICLVTVGDMPEFFRVTGYLTV